MKKTVSAIPVLLAVFSVMVISGCVMPGGDGTAGGPGLAVEKFEPTLRDADSGETVGLHLEVRNMGGFNNAPVIAELIGIDLPDWGMGAIPPCQALGFLPAPDPQSGTLGGLGKADWYLYAPILVKGQTLPYEPIARVYYYYETYATKPFWLVTSEELRRVVQTGGSLETEPTTYTAGPMSVEMLTGRFVKTSDIINPRFQLQMRIENIGGGQIYGTDYPVSLEISLPSGVQPIGDCPREIRWTAYGTMPSCGAMQPANFGTLVRVWNGKSTDITCELQITQPPTSKVKKEFRVKLGYIYYIDAPTQVNVRGIQEGAFV